MNALPVLYVALPVLNESNNIDNIIECLNKQSMEAFRLVVCVNQYENWRDNPDKVDICDDNLLSIEKLNKVTILDIDIIDRSTLGNGWPSKKGGVGWARKTLMDHIAARANENDIIVSIDADTYYPSNYLQSILEYFVANPNICGLAIPYYHNLENDITNRLILRYEIYMRYYAVNMMRINNPYCYTALGSAMAFPVWAYKKAGGLTPVAAGEDFYFLQKLVKIGKIGVWNNSVAYPSSRFSDRVVFGTGPALIKGHGGNWESYPHYHFNEFDKIAATFGMFGRLYNSDMVTPMDEFLFDQSKTKNIWAPLRKNYKDEKNFVRACHNKVDGLRILQFLRKQQENINLNDESIIYNFLVTYFKDDIDCELLLQLENLDYENSPTELLMELRDYLFQLEMEFRKSRLFNAIS